MGAKREERIMDERRNAFESKKTNKTDARLECPSRIFDVEHNENVLQQKNGRIEHGDGTLVGRERNLSQPRRKMTTR